MKYFYLLCFFSASLFAKADTFWPYRIQIFSELELLESREALTVEDQAPQTPLLPLRIEKRILEFILHHDYLGSVIVVQNGQPLFTEGFGPSSPRVVNGSHTTFRWDSVTKLLTTVAMLQLSEASLIDLDEPITTYLPEYSNPLLYPGFSGTPPVTVRSMLEMRSGIVDMPGPGFPNWLDRPPNITDIANYVSVRSRSGIGNWKYTNSGFNISALILGCVIDPSRDPSLVYQEYMRDHVFTPAGMTTAFAPRVVAEDNPVAHAHIWDSKGRLQMIGTNFYPNYTSQRVGTGNIYGSVWDFYKFTIALNSGKLITQANLTMMLDDNLGGWIPGEHSVNGHSYLAKGGAQTGDHAYYMRFDNNTMIFLTANADPRSLNLATGEIGDPNDRIQYLGPELAKLLFPSSP